MTLPEVLISIAISGLIIAALLTCVISIGKEVRRSLADTLLQQQAGQVQDRLMRVVRSMSASEGVAFGDPQPGGVFRRIVTARGPAPDYPRQEVYYDSTALALNWRTNRNQGGTGISLLTSRSEIALDSVLFYPSLKPDGSVDGTVVNVFIELNDKGASGRRNPGGSVKTNFVHRIFAVAVRNP